MAKQVLLFVTFCIFLLTAPAPASEETLSIPGTGDSQTLLTLHAEDFATRNPSLRVQIPPSVGTIGGTQHLFAAKAVLSPSARPRSPQEQQRELQQKTFAYSPIVFVANLPTPCLDSSTAAQIVGIYSGRLTSWAQLAYCQKTKVFVANREDGDSSRRVLVEKVPGFAGSAAFAGEALYSTQETQVILEKHPQTIGYLPLASTLGTSLRVLSYQGVSPSVQAVQQGDYPLTVPPELAWKG